MTIEARRHNPRVSLKEITYVNFGSGNRGVILDVSEGGLRFKTASPLGQNEDIHFSLSQGDRSEGAAQLAWMDESRTTGGLRFTTVPPEIRKQIRQWIERAESTDPLRTATANALREEELAAAVAATATRNVDAQETAASHTRVPETPAFGSQPWLKSSFSHRPLLSTEPEMPALPTETSATEASPTGSVRFVAPRPMHHRWAIAFLVLLIVLGAATAAAEYYYPSEAHHFMSQMQSRVERFVNPVGKRGPSETENASMAGVSRFEGSFEPGKAPRDPFAQPVIPPDSSANPPTAQAGASHSFTTPSSNADAPKNNAETDLELAQTYLSRSDNPDEKAKAIQLLWLATEKGNVDAEMELADLYARGDGVSKSCVQARILLKAASAVNAVAAQPKLDALDQSGCS